MDTMVAYPEMKIAYLVIRMLVNISFKLENVCVFTIILPELNPIEQFWHQVKTRLKRVKYLQMFISIKRGS